MAYPDDSKLRTIPGFSTLKALKLGRLWYIIDNTWTDIPPHRRSIGGWHTSYGAACFYADMWYRRQYT